MVPQTVVAFIGFLLLIAPGLLFEMLRERRRPAFQETAFREASRTAFTSLLFTAAALTLLAFVRAAWPGLMPDPGRWIREKGRYLETHYRLIAAFFMVEMVLASALALLADSVLKRQATGKIVQGDLWYQVFRMDRPRGKVPWVSLQLKDKTQIAGVLNHYSVGEKLENREIALMHNRKGTGLKRITAGGIEIRFDGWQQVVVAAEQIAFLKVMYLPGAGPPKESWWQRNMPPPSAVSPAPTSRASAGG